MNGKLRNMTSVYLTDDEGILCLYRIGSRVADHLYVGSAGGHFEAKELDNTKACILREMQEEIGLCEADLEDLVLRYVTLRLKNGEIRQNYYFFARIRSRIPLSSTEGSLRWFNYEEILDLEMPCTAKHMIRHYVKQGRFDLLLYAGIAETSGITFVPLCEFE